MPTPSVPAPFPKFNTRTLAAGSLLVRLHSPDFDGTACNPCRGDPTRFAPLTRPDGACLPTLYAADSLEAAVHESIFHDLDHDLPNKFIRKSKVTSRAISWIEVTQDLKVVRLNEPDLNRLRMTRTDLIDTPRSAYPATARWAEAFHRNKPKTAGLAWTSRRCDPDAAYVFFEDRLPTGALRVDRTVKIAESAPDFAEIRAIGRRAGITITV